MKESQMVEGMPVIISSSNETAISHTVSSVMKGMVGKIYKIKYTASTRYGKAAVINGYYWHAKDLSLPNTTLKKPKPQHFDIKELVT